MTFKQLLETAVNNVDQTKQYAGRTEAIDAVIYHNLAELFKKEVEKSKWERWYVSNPYGNEDPYLEVIDHDVRKRLSFKVRLKKAGKKQSYYGDTTYYMPVVAFLTNEDLMDVDVVEHLNKLHDESSDVQEMLAREAEKTKIREEHKDLIERINSAITEFNELPVEIRDVFRHNISSPCYW